MYKITTDLKISGTASISKQNIDDNGAVRNIDLYNILGNRIINFPTYTINKNVLTLNDGSFIINGKNIRINQETLTLNDNTISIYVSDDGHYHQSSTYNSGLFVIANVRNKQILNFINSNGDSFVDLVTGATKHKLELPYELHRIEEKFPITQIINSDSTLTYNYDYDVSIHKNQSPQITYYVDKLNGSDTTGDGTIEKPFMRINKAITQTPLANTIMIKGNQTYTRDYTWSTSIVDRTIDIIGYDGTPILSGELENPTFVKTTGYNNVYQITQNLVFNIADYNIIDQYGHPYILNQTTSIALVDSTAGTFFKSGNITYFHLSSSTAPNNNVKVIMELTNGRVQDNTKLYMENIHFTNSFRGFHAETQSANKQCYVYCKNVTFGLSASLNSFNGRGSNCILQDCIAEYGMQDAFNYHADFYSLGIIPWFIELNCIGRYSGFDNLPNNNGSTAHDGVVGLRINGTYYATYGRVVHDVHDKTCTVNINCHSYGSTRTDNTLGQTAFTSGQGSDLTGISKVYLYSCKVDDNSTNSVQITSDGLSKIYLYDTLHGNNPQFNKSNPYDFLN
ncbi:TPA: hypothetical protein L2Y74_001076 [Escherichia coli]|nr:hypothetical protein [Escherichia coli]